VKSTLLDVFNEKKKTKKTGFFTSKGAKEHNQQVFIESLVNIKKKQSTCLA
jgi:hypothetical protein